MELNKETLREILTEQRKELEKTIDIKLSSRLSEQSRDFGLKLASRLSEQSKDFDSKLDSRLSEQSTGFGKTIDAKLLEQRREYERHMGALHEDMQHSVAAIAEQLIDIKETVDSHTEMIGHISEEVTKIKEELRTKVSRDDFVILDNRVASLEHKTA